MEQPADRPPSPYVGPRPFAIGEKLFGRDDEIAELSNLLRARRLVLLHSISGAGKTSLIQAGVVPALGEAFQALPVVRLNQIPPSTARPDPEVFNRYTYSSLASLENNPDLGTAPRLDTQELLSQSKQPESLSWYLKSHLKRLEEAGKLHAGRALLLFDQFEEVLNLDPIDLPAKREFFVQLAAVVSDYSYWAIFAMREDYIAGLEPYLSFFPARLSTRFRLELLDREAAIQAIRQPALQWEPPVEFELEAAEKLVDELSQVAVLEGGEKVKVTGTSVEPVQLQVVCRRLWEAPRSDPGRISLQDVTNLGSVDNALADFYDENIAGVATNSGKSERELREWIETQLITPQGFRNQVIQEAVDEQGIDPITINLLTRVYLVRLEERRGVNWYELTHDRLVEPIRSANAVWRERNPAVLTPIELGLDLKETGWGIIFPAGLVPEPFLKALKELLEHRKKQVGRPTCWKIFAGESGRRPDETAQAFLERHGAGFGLLNPEKVPYYLLLVGSPEQIPLEFQQALDLQYSVGRIYFDREDDYQNYARSVVYCETHKGFLPRRAAVFAPRHPGDPATRFSAKEVARPLAGALAKDEELKGWQVESILDKQATRSQLAHLLGGPEAPAVLLTLSHGIQAAVGEDNPVPIGALVSQDWRGPDQEPGPLKPSARAGWAGCTPLRTRRAPRLGRSCRRCSSACCKATPPGKPWSASTCALRC
jgi:hypothetical protein